MSQLTVVIPVYNMGDVVHVAVASVLAQPVDASVIVVDDASSDPVSLSAAHAADPRVSLLRHDRNAGAAAARNTGAKAAKTAWLTFLDADDWMLPETLATRLDFATAYSVQNPDHTAIYGCGWVTLDKVTRVQTIRLPNPALSTTDMASGCWFSPGSCVLMPTALYLSHLQDETMQRLEDYDWSIRLGLSGARFVVQDIAGAVIQPSGRASFAAVVAAADVIQQRYAPLATSHKMLHDKICAYLDVEVGAAAWRERAYLTAALRLVRSFLRVPRARLHLSPGWTYRPLNTPVDMPNPVAPYGIPPAKGA